MVKDVDAREWYTTGVDKRAWYDERFGAARVASFEPRLRDAFARAGIESPYSLEGNTGDTLSGHRLAAYATATGGEPAANAFMEAIMRRYFCESRAPCDREALLESAREANLDVDEARRVLSDEDAYAADVERDLAKYARGVSGVPFFIIAHGERTLMLSGAQPPEAFADAFSELLGEDVVLAD